MRNITTFCTLLVTGLCCANPETVTNSVEIDIDDVDKPHPSSSSRLLPPISKSPLDRRLYRGVLLQNGIQVILVSDPNTTRAAASLSVSVGSMNDPPGILGMAHFLEHMLFLGNEKYPEENGFQKYISEHGGHSNAATQADKTYYFFRVSPPALKDSLERFAHLFISPLFTESALEREVLAVESEHQKYIPDDRRRVERIEAGTGRSSHPFTRYRVGTLQTLLNRPRSAGLNVRSALLDFHHTHYSASRMHLALLGSQSLDELQTIVEGIFLDIPNRADTNNNGNETMDDNDHTHNNQTIEMEPLYGPDEVGERLDIVPMGNYRSLQLMFPVPYIHQYYKNTALGYISHLMGQEGAGSLSAILKRKHWAESVTVGGYLPTQGLTFFKVKIALTLEGLGNVNQIVKYIFQYIAMMREVGPQLWFYQEVKDINLIHFRFRDEAYPMDLVSKLSVNMIQYPVEKVLHAVGIDEDLEFDPTSINRTLTFLTPQNCRLFVTSTEFENKTAYVEEYLGVHYNRGKIGPELMEDWGEAGLIPEFHLPPKNEFVASVFDLKSRDGQSLEDPFTPRKLKDCNVSQLWYLQDTNFLLPKATVTVELLTPLAYADPIHANLMYLWSSLITESLGEFQYSASLAGLESEVSATEGGLMVTVRGYDHKMAQFIRKIFLRILTLSSNLTSATQNLATLKDTLVQVILNMGQAQPYEVANSRLRQLLLERRWSTGEALDAINDLTLQKLELFIAQFLSRLKFRWIFYGNLTPQECIQIASECESLFLSNGTQPLFPSVRPWMPMRVLELPPGSNYVLQSTTPSHSSSCTLILFQIGQDSTQNNLLVSLLSRISHQHLFDRLRTKEGLGYAVWADVYMDKFYATVSYRIVVQGSAAPAFVEDRISNFLLEFEDLLGNMTEKEFLRHRKSLANIKSTLPKTMTDKIGSLHREIISQRGNFHRIRVEVEALDGITLKHLQEFYRERVINPETRRKLAVHIAPLVSNSSSLLNATDSVLEIGNTTSILSPNDTSAAIVIEDIPTWKETMRLFPSLNPFNENKNINDTNVT